MHNLQLYYMSDMHLEMRSRNWVKKILCSKIQITERDESTLYILVLAGDIGNPYMDSWKELILHCHAIFDTVLYVSGNHEYYHRKSKRTMLEVDEYIQTSFAQYPNLYYMNNRYLDVKLLNRTVRFIGTTLWSHVRVEQTKAVTEAMNDFRHIYPVAGKLWSIDDLNSKHHIDRQFVTESLHDSHNTVILTHHVPSPTLIPAKYSECTDMVDAFSSEMQEIYEKHNVKWWIYGHSHGSTMTLRKGCLFLSNCMGYIEESDIYADFDPVRRVRV